ncbi:GNAT family N-acetyltransferase [Nonomuraea salmonea]|uniref:GNAT family N-acetyltransferase n=3 Tax=Nonomuraea TaxID=83681 RepID=A0ABV5P4A7_9ACTN
MITTERVGDRARLDAVHALLRSEFAASELEAQESFPVREVAGARRFAVARLAGDRVLAALTCDYIPLVTQREPVAVIGGGHIVTAPGERGRGHARMLLARAEELVFAEAAARGERPVLALVESRPETTAFWARNGFRQVEHVRYVQPPMRVDRLTGRPLTPPRPHPLMARTADPAATAIPARLLADAVHALWRHWYEPPALTLTPAARARASTLLWADLYPAFIASLPAAGEVPLAP